MAKAYKSKNGQTFYYDSATGRYYTETASTSGAGGDPTTTRQYVTRPSLIKELDGQRSESEKSNPFSRIASKMGEPARDVARKAEKAAKTRDASKKIGEITRTKMFGGAGDPVTTVVRKLTNDTGKELATASGDAIGRIAKASRDKERAQDASDLMKLENLISDPRTQMGSMIPELMDILGESSAASAQADPAALAAQKAALDKMLGLAEGGGWTAEEKARRLQQRADSDQWLRAQREADMANLAERGMLGSGAELAALASDRQAAASRNSLQDARAAADYERRALDAMMGAGELGGTMARDSFDRAFRTGEADDTWKAGKADLVGTLKGSDIEHTRDAIQAIKDEQFAIAMEKLRLGVGAAEGREGRAVEETGRAWDVAGGVAKHDADVFTEALDRFNKGAIGGNEQTSAEERGATESVANKQTQGVTNVTEGTVGIGESIYGAQTGPGFATAKPPSEEEEED